MQRCEIYLAAAALLVAAGSGYDVQLVSYSEPGCPSDAIHYEITVAFGTAWAHERDGCPSTRVEELPSKIAGLISTPPARPRERHEDGPEGPLAQLPAHEEVVVGRAFF